MTPVQIFTTRGQALQWSKTASKTGRLYVLTFEPFFKVGSSQDFKNRFHELIAFRGRSLNAAFERAIVGPPHPNYREFESQIHAILAPFRSERRPGFKEWYRREEDVESSILTWMDQGFQTHHFALIEGLSILEEERQEEGK